MAEQIFRKDCAWKCDHDFIGADEITVTITLAEYRELVKADSTWENKYRELNGRNDELRTRVEELERKINTYKEMFQLVEEEE